MYRHSIIIIINVLQFLFTVSSCRLYGPVTFDFTHAYRHTHTCMEGYILCCIYVNYYYYYCCYKQSIISTGCSCNTSCSIIILIVQEILIKVIATTDIYFTFINSIYNGNHCYKYGCYQREIHKKGTRNVLFNKLDCTEQRNLKYFWNKYVTYIFLVIYLIQSHTVTA